MSSITFSKPIPPVIPPSVKDEAMRLEIQLLNDPDNQNILIRLAASYALQKNMMGASALAMRAVLIDPTSIEALFVNARIQRLIGNAEESQDYYLKILTLSPDNPEAYFEYVQLLIESGHENKAVRIAQNYLMKNPDHVRLQSLIAPYQMEAKSSSSQKAKSMREVIEILEKMPELKSAIDSHQQELARNPGNTEVRRALISMYIQLGCRELANFHTRQLSK